MGIGSWPRPRWMLAGHARPHRGEALGRGFEATAEDATRLAVAAQLRAGVDVVTDGEQRRDNYASFVGSRLDNCQLIPLDRPAAPGRRPRGRSRPRCARWTCRPARSGTRPSSARSAGAAPSLSPSWRPSARVTDKPVKVALPGPYLLTRIMWMECISDRAYRSREHLAEDVVRVLREEIHCLLAGGATLVQLDEPVLSEVVFTGAKNTRSFMCGALSEKGDVAAELAFATDLINQVTAGLPAARLALHVCRGNWTRDEAAALTGTTPLLPVFERLTVAKRCRKRSDPFHCTVCRARFHHTGCQ